MRMSPAWDYHWLLGLATGVSMAFLFARRFGRRRHAFVARCRLFALAGDSSMFSVQLGSSVAVILNPPNRGTKKPDS